MITRITLFLSLAGVVTLGAGCQLAASHSEVATWRAVRAEHDEHQRLMLLSAYAREYPQGVWVTAANEERMAAEESVWATSASNVEGLRFYLDTYPDGTYVEQATARVAAMSVVSERVEVEETHEVEVAAATAADLAETRRLWVGRAMEFWTRTLMGIRNYGSPISAVARANPTFSDAFGAAPAPLCSATSCIKHYHSHFAVPNPGGTRIERDIDLFMRINLGARGRVERVEVLLPGMGFSRWYELENRVLVDDFDPTQRMAAIEWALGRIEPIVAELGAGGRAVDVIPDPIPSISAADSAASEVAEDAADEVPGEAHTTAPPASSGGETASGGGEGTSTGAGADTSLDDLLAAATGGIGTGEAPEETPPPVAEEVPEETLVFPIGLRAIQVRNYRIVLFAAGDGDTGPAYDGFYIELAE